MTTSSEQAAHSPLPTGTEGRDIPGHAGAGARFVVAFALFVGGLVLMGSGMSGVDGGVWLFVGGLAAAQPRPVSAHHQRTAAGEVAVPATPRTTVVLVLRWTDAGWRVAEAR